MGLQRVNTAYFDVVNTSDPDVSGAEGHGENEWVAVSEVTVGPDATRVRIRALTRREMDSCPFNEDGKLLGSLVDLGVHPDDKAIVGGPEPIPWHFQRTLGALIYRVSTNPFDPTK
jgi:hypothetical protein